MIFNVVEKSILFLLNKNKTLWNILKYLFPILNIIPCDDSKELVTQVQLYRLNG